MNHDGTADDELNLLFDPSDILNSDEIRTNNKK